MPPSMSPPRPAIVRWMKRSNSTDSQTDLPADEFESFKALLGPLAIEYTEPQLRQLYAEMRALAEILLDFYLYKKKKLNDSRRL